MVTCANAWFSFHLQEHTDHKNTVLAMDHTYDVYTYLPHKGNICAGQQMGTS